jgi:predicted SAM-dependent methyltransferase
VAHDHDKPLLAAQEWNMLNIEHEFDVQNLVQATRGNEFQDMNFNSVSFLYCPRALEHL